LNRRCKNNGKIVCSKKKCQKMIAGGSGEERTKYLAKPGRSFFEEIPRLRPPDRRFREGV